MEKRGAPAPGSPNEHRMDSPARAVGPFEQCASYQYLLARPRTSPSPRLRSELWHGPLECSLMVSFPCEDSETWPRPKVWPRSCVTVLARSCFPLQEWASGRVVQLLFVLLIIMSDQWTRL